MAKIALRSTVFETLVTLEIKIQLTKLEWAISTVNMTKTIKISKFSNSENVV